MFRRTKPTSRKTTRLGIERLEERTVPSWVVPPRVARPRNVEFVSLDNGAASDVAEISRREVDWYRVELPAGRVTFSASAENSDIDTVIAVYGENRRRIGYDDDSGEGTDSELALDLDAGTYFFGVTNFRRNPNGEYNWAIETEGGGGGGGGGGSDGGGGGDDSFEPNDTSDAASDLGTPTNSRTLSNLVLNDDDWYRFSTTATGTSGNQIAFSFSHAQGDIDVVMYAEDGTFVGASDSATDLEVISLDGLPAGTYYVCAYGYNGAQNPNYSMTVTPPTGGGGGGGGGQSEFQIDLRISGMTSGQQAVFRQAAERWAEIIIGDIPDVTYQGMQIDDILIDASAVNIDGNGGVLGRAGPDAWRTNSYLPAYGVMEFDTADLNWLEANGQLVSVILHEMGHVLGIGTMWQNMGLLTGAGSSDPRFIGSAATAEYNRIFGTSANGVPVENQYGQGSRDSHWRESVLDNELMTSQLNSGYNPISRITVASLADMGYEVNMSAAESYARPNVVASNLIASAPELNMLPPVVVSILPIDMLQGSSPKQPASQCSMPHYQANVAVPASHDELDVGRVV
jgi:hypothetical protein